MVFLIDKNIVINSNQKHYIIHDGDASNHQNKQERGSRRRTLISRASIFHCQGKEARNPNFMDPNCSLTNQMALKKALVDFNHQAVASSEQHKEVSLSLADEIAHICPVQSNPQALVRLLNEGKTRCYGLIIDALAESPSTMDKFIDVFFREWERLLTTSKKWCRHFLGEGKRNVDGAGVRDNGSWAKKKIGKRSCPWRWEFLFWLVIFRTSNQ